MTPEERQLLDGLFDRIRQSSAAPRDREAEDLIRHAVEAQPYAPYLLAQAVIVQEEALKAAAARMQELEAERDAARAEAQRPASGGFLGSLFGGPPAAAPAGRSGSGIPSLGGARSFDREAPAAPMQPGGPWGGPGGAFGGRPGPFGGAGAGAGGGSFLRGALATAAGVAGGALLFSGIQSMLSGGLGEQATALGEDVQSALGGAPVAPVNAEDTSAAVDDAAFDDFDVDDGGDGGDWA